MVYNYSLARIKPSTLVTTGKAVSGAGRIALSTTADKLREAAVLHAAPEIVEEHWNVKSLALHPPPSQSSHCKVA